MNKFKIQNSKSGGVTRTFSRRCVVNFINVENFQFRKYSSYLCRLKSRVCIAILFLLILCYSNALGQHTFPKHEFRGVWIASVMNIDWPSSSGLSSVEQQKEFINILQMHKANGMNAVVVQIRPAADAFYPSRYEPWSSWLTGKLGRAPQPYYDPLKFMIDEAHKLGLEFHAWFNPYRGVMNVEANGVDSASVALRHPDWFLKYDKNLYFNPGLPQVRQFVTNVIMDVVNRYDVDGIHFDDYFYPYKVAGLNFPDSTAFQEFGNKFQSVDDWRRANVDSLIKNISDSVKQVKPYVKFGISPFGVWRNQDKDPAGSATRAGQTCYDDLYADVLKWLREGWIDYVTPQLYWSITFEPAPYEVLAQWWSKNSYGKPVYIGQAAYRINNAKDDRWKNADQLPRQIRINRTLPNVKGSVFFSSKSFAPNPLGILDTLKNNLYKFPALIPPFCADSTFHPQYPLSFTGGKKGLILYWKENSPKQLSPHMRYVVYRFRAGETIDLKNPKNIHAVLSDTNPAATGLQWYTDGSAKRRKKYWYVVTGINRYNIESNPDKVFPIRYFKNSWRVYAPARIGDR